MVPACIGYEAVDVNRMACRWKPFEMLQTAFEQPNSAAIVPLGEYLVEAHTDQEYALIETADRALLRSPQQFQGLVARVVFTPVEFLDSLHKQRRGRLGTRLAERRCINGKWKRTAHTC